MDFSFDDSTRLYILKRMTADCLHYANSGEATTNFERLFSPRTWLESARNFGKTRFRRFAIFNFWRRTIFFEHIFGFSYFWQILQEIGLFDVKIMFLEAFCYKWSKFQVRRTLGAYHIQPEAANPAIFGEVCKTL